MFKCKYETNLCEGSEEAQKSEMRYIYILKKLVQG